jgi:hypothetical protein
VVNVDLKGSISSPTHENLEFRFSWVILVCRNLDKEFIFIIIIKEYHIRRENLKHSII